MTNSSRDITAPQRLGTCPQCDTGIPQDLLGIEYVPDEGWPQFLAECPNCRDIVHVA